MAPGGKPGPVLPLTSLSFHIFKMGMIVDRRNPDVSSHSVENVQPNFKPVLHPLWNAASSAAKVFVYSTTMKLASTGKERIAFSTYGFRTMSYPQAKKS